MEVQLFAFLSLLFASGQSQQLRILGPLEAVETTALNIWCASNESISGFVLREGTAVSTRSSRGFENDTHQEFVVDPVTRVDDGIDFVCAVLERLSDPATLTVFYADPFVFSPDPNFINDVLTLPQGNDTTLSFSIIASPMTSPMTTPTLMPMTSSVMRVDNSVVFSNVQREDAGIYLLTMTIQGSSPEISVTSTANITLVVEHGPIFNVVSMTAKCVKTASMELVTCYVMLDTDVTIDCTFISVPDGVGEIYVPSNLNVSNVAVVETRIMIDNVAEDNLGTYQCMASNMVAGERVPATINIEVIEGDVTTMDPPTTTSNSASVSTPALYTLSLLVLHTVFFNR